MKIFLLIYYFSSVICMGFSFPNMEQQQKETQSKRDTSYSYVASDINSKEGTHIKTIAVIKNIDTNNKKNEPINIKQNYNKNRNWADKIHENFEAFGKIPEVPDIDDLFEFTKNYNPITKKPKTDIKSESPKKSEKVPESEIKEKELDKPKAETENDDKRKEEVKEIKLQNIPDDVELINTEMNLKQKSQSLQYVPQPQGSKKINVKIQLPQSKPENKYLTQYSTPQHSVRQYFMSDEKLSEYKKIPTNVKPTYGNNNFPLYSPAAQASPPNNIPAPSYPNGITNNGFIGTQTNKPPYLAPNKLKKSQNNGKTKTTNIPVIGFPLSSQTPYIAPNIKKAYDIQINKNKVINQNGINNQTSNLNGRNNQTNSIVVPLNLRIGSTIPLGAVTRSRGLRY